MENVVNAESLERSLKELADIKFALDQSTIVAITRSARHHQLC